MAIVCSMAPAMDTKHTAELSLHSLSNATGAEAAQKTCLAPLAATANLRSLSSQSKDKNATKEQKIVEFYAAVGQPDKDTKKLYRMATDPAIQALLKEEKTRTELNFYKLVDAQGKSIVEQAIENNDAPFVSRALKYLNDKQRSQAFAYAGEQKKPRVLIALANQQSESTKKALDRQIYQMKKFTSQQLETYRAALDLLAKQAQTRAAVYHKAFGHLPDDVVSKICQGISPAALAMKGQDLPAALESAIKLGDHETFNRLIECGVTNENLEKIVSLIVQYEQPSLLEKFVIDCPYISEALQKNLIEMITKKRSALEQETDTEKRDERKDKIKKLSLLIEISLPAKTKEKNEDLYKALYEHHLGKSLYALNTGANPNETKILDLLVIKFKHYNSNFIQDLIHFLIAMGLKKDALIACHYNKQEHPLIFWALYYRNSNAAEALYGLGANLDLISIPSALNSYNQPLGYTALSVKDPELLKTLIKKDSNQKFCDFYKNQAFSHAVITGSLEHAQVLLKAGAKLHTLIDTLNEKVNGATKAQRIIELENFDTLSWLLTQGLDPNTTIVFDNKKYSLLELAIKRDSPAHAECLLDAGAKMGQIETTFREGLYSTSEYPLTAQLLFEDKALNLLKKLLKKGLNPNNSTTLGNNKDYSWLKVAMLWNKPKHYQALMNARAKPIGTYETPKKTITENPMIKIKQLEHKKPTSIFERLASFGRSLYSWFIGTQKSTPSFSAAYLSALGETAQ